MVFVHTVFDFDVGQVFYEKEINNPDNIYDFLLQGN